MFNILSLLLDHVLFQEVLQTIKNLDSVMLVSISSICLILCIWEFNFVLSDNMILSQEHDFVYIN